MLVGMALVGILSRVLRINALVQHAYLACLCNKQDCYKCIAREKPRSQISVKYYRSRATNLVILITFA